MRNWNQWFRLRKRLCCLRFQTTYEELKLNFQPESSVASAEPSFQTTYEELKLRKIFLMIAVKMFASRLPMRNWNSITIFRLWLAIHESFQTTYEELKLSIGLWLTVDCMLPDYLWGIETGQQKDRSRKSYLCFQTTYEELKLKSIIFIK